MNDSAPQQPPMNDPDLKRRWTSRQFIVTVVGMGLVFTATMFAKDVLPLSSVVIVAITGAAGLNIQQARTK